MTRRGRKARNEEPEWFRDIPPSVREKVKREQEAEKPAISIDAFRSLMLNALAEQQVAREKRKKRTKAKRAKEVKKPNKKKDDARGKSQTLEKWCS